MSVLYCQSPALFWCALALIVCFFVRRGAHRVRAVLDLVLGLLCIVGGVALYWEDNAWHMGRFVISPELRGCHVGTALLETALTDIFAQDIREVTMEARDTTVHILKWVTIKLQRS